MVSGFQFDSWNYCKKGQDISFPLSRDPCYFQYFQFLEGGFKNWGRIDQKIGPYSIRKVRKTRRVNISNNGSSEF